MSDFIANSQTYNIVTENELAVILSHFSSEFIFSIVQDALSKRFEAPAIIAAPNVVSALEQNFKTIQAQYNSSEATQEINRVRLLTYREVIDQICKEFNLRFTIDEDVDLYSAAYYLYDFFVCRFSVNLITFFANFIYKERNEIFDNLGLSELKKNKDSSTIYGKKIYKDIKLAVINANIDQVVYGVSGFDINLYNIFNTVINNKNIVNFLCTLVSPDTDFFKTSYVNILSTEIRPVYITGIRFALQELGIGEINQYEETKNEEPTV